MIRLLCLAGSGIVGDGAQDTSIQPGEAALLEFLSGRFKKQAIVKHGVIVVQGIKIKLWDLHCVVQTMGGFMKVSLCHMIPCWSYGPANHYRYFIECDLLHCMSVSRTCSKYFSTPFACASDLSIRTISLSLCGIYT